MRVLTLALLVMLAVGCSPSECCGREDVKLIARARVPSSSAAEASETIFQVGGDVKAPVVTHRAMPDVSDLPGRIKITGPLILSAVVNRDGRVISVKIVRDGTSPPVGPRYAEAIRNWRFQPGTLHGRPVVVELMLTVSIHPE